MVVELEWTHICPKNGRVYNFSAYILPTLFHKLCKQPINAARTTDSFGTLIKPLKQKPTDVINNVGK